MKKILFIATFLLLHSCKSGYIEKELKGNLFDKFDYELFNNNYEGLKKGIQNGSSYIYNGTEFYPDSDDNWLIYIYPQKHQFYSIYNEYYRNNFNLKQRGKLFGNECYNHLINQKLKIGIWYEYDEQGKLIKETDEDKKFGKFGYNELLKFLDKEKQINLNKGVYRNNSGDIDFEIYFFNSNKSDKKLWKVRTKIVISDLGCDENGAKIGYKSNSYFIDGNTGEQIKNYQLAKENYKEILK